MTAGWDGYLRKTRGTTPGSWRERMELLHLRELLSVIAHFGPVRDSTTSRIRDIIRRFS
jgi:hypothetical protein